jgi:hypothetical protein
MTKWVVVWEYQGFSPLSDGAIGLLCDGDSEKALLEMRKAAIIVPVDDEKAEAIL